MSFLRAIRRGRGLLVTAIGKQDRLTENPSGRIRCVAVETLQARALRWPEPFRHNHVVGQSIPVRKRFVGPKPRKAFDSISDLRSGTR